MLAFSFSFVKSKSINFQKLAGKLIEAKTAKEREILLKDVPETDFLMLAKAVKEVCYSFWTSEPTKAQSSAKTLQTVHKISPQTEIKAYLKWITGISEITRGKLASAVKKLDESAEIFLSLKKDYEAAQTQVAKLYALALLGRYKEAVDTGEKSLKIFEKYNDETAAGKVEKNIGNIVSRYELHSEAEKFYLSAQKRFVKLGNYEELTMVENGLAITYSALNDFRRAENFYLQALKRARKLKMSLTEAEIEASMGNLALFRGKFDRALKFLELSRRKYESLKMPHQTAVAELEIADVYLELNLAKEAFSIYETIAERLHKLKLQGEEARARANFGRSAVVLKEEKTARSQLAKAAKLYVAEKNQVGAATVKLNEASLELDSQNYQKALTLAGEAENILKQSENVRQKLTALWLKAEALINLGENKKAEKLLSEIFSEAIKQEQPNLAQSARISLGKLALRQKDYKQAERHFKSAVKLIETLRAPLPAEEFRMAFLAGKLAPFEYLSKIYLSKGEAKEAFLYVEKARARSLAENLNSDLSFGSEKKNVVSTKLVEKLENLREELNWFYSRLSRAGEAETKDLQTEAKLREKQITDVMRQIGSTCEGKTAKPQFIDFKLLQNQLGNQKMLLEFVNFDGNLSTFVVTEKRIEFFADLAKENEIVELLEGLHFQFGSLRYGAKNLEKFVGELKKRADFYLQKLYEKLLAPLESLFEDKNLVIVPVGVLHYVPFHSLRAGENYLIETREVVYAPSATVWQRLTEKPSQKLENALLIGFADEKIPFVNQEVETLHKIFPKSKIFTDEAATFSAFTKNASRFEVLHLACHGQFRPENPLFSSLHLADGWVTVRDICAQKLKAEVVTLSACETGFNKIFAGEEILGLSRGFLSAGANSLILSLWMVNDEAALDLMKAFYENLQRGETVSASLRVAQNNFIKLNVHPYFWSPFAVIGR